MKKMNIDQTARELSVVGVDVCREYPDIRYLPCGTSIRLSNDRKGREKNALVGFESAGGCERPLRKRPVEKGVRVRRHPPKQIKCYGLACGECAKTERKDAEIIALFMQFQPGAGRELPSDLLCNLRAHVTSRAKIVEARKRQGPWDMFDDVTGEQLAAKTRSCFSA